MNGSKELRKKVGKKQQQSRKRYMEEMQRETIQQTMDEKLGGTLHETMQAVTIN